MPDIFDRLTLEVGPANLRRKSEQKQKKKDIFDRLTPPEEERGFVGQFGELSGISPLARGLKLAYKNPAEAAKQLAQIPPALAEQLAGYVQDISRHPLGPGIGAAAKVGRELTLPTPPGMGRAEAVGRAVDVGLPLPLGLQEVGKDISAERYGAAAGGALGLGTMALPGLAKKIPIPRRAKLGRTSVTIEGVRIPQAAGEASRATAMGKIRGLLQGSFVGDPLRRLTQAQGRLANFALKRIANRVTLGAERGWWKHEKPAGAFHGGASALKGKAQPIYNSIDNVVKEVRPGVSPEQIAKLRGPSRVRYRRYQLFAHKVQKKMGELLADLEVQEMIALDPQVSQAIRTRLANIELGGMTPLPFEAYQSARSSLMTLRKRANKAGNNRASRLLHEGIEAVDEVAEDMLKYIDGERGTTLAKDWRRANDMWRRASLSEDLGDLFREITEGSRPSIQREMGMKPIPPTVHGKTLIEKIELLQKDIERVYGAKAYKDIEKIGEILATGQRAAPGGIAGHFMTLSAVIVGLTAPATIGGALVGGTYGAVTMTAAALASELILGRVVAAAIASKNGRAAVLTMLRTKAGSAAAILAAIKVVSLANQNTEHNMEGGLPTPPAPQAIEVGPADLRQDTEIMLQAKDGEITPAEANQQIPRRRRAIRLLRPPPQE